ncbi:MAG TPA: hypothetical protein VMW65_18505 [Chloroflexota bacterium]|nr:hypothetical protein [Chloroflexota bacterium]
MGDYCPTCHRQITNRDTRQRQRQLRRQIAALQREILAIEFGALTSVIAHQSSAPSCTICSQAPPGKPGRPTPKADLVRPLQREVDALEQQLNRHSGGPSGV